jgi:hypothetical protein
MTTSDLDRLTAYVRGQLSNRIRDLRLSLRGTGLVLSGHCQSYYLKQLAQEVIKRVSGLPIADNEIEVAYRLHDQGGRVVESADSADCSCVYNMICGPARPVTESEPRSTANSTT